MPEAGRVDLTVSGLLSDFFQTIMTEEISLETFTHLVDLAALELTLEQAEYLRAQLNNQLRSIHELAAIELPEGVLPAAHGVPYTAENSQPPREDRWVPCANASEIIDQVPQVDGGYVIVPDIPHTTLE